MNIPQNMRYNPSSQHSVADLEKAAVAAKPVVKKVEKIRFNSEGEPLFRASKAHTLMQGGNRITRVQLQDLQALQNRKDASKKSNTIKPLTAKMEEKLEQLKKKQDAPFELGEGAKTYIREMWIQTEHGYIEPVETFPMMKGNEVEKDSAKLIDTKFPIQEKRKLNTKHFTNDWVMGTPDIILSTLEELEDIKSSFNVTTYYKVNDLEMAYYGQGQVYMWLLGYKVFRVHYCLVDTPEHIIDQIKSRFFYKYGNDTEDPEYLAACEEIDKQHKVSHLPVKARIKTFEFDYNPEYIEELKKRIIAARKYYQECELGGFTKKITWESK